MSDMNQCWWRWYYKLGLGISLVAAALTSPVQAQVTPDGTLGTQVNGSLAPCIGGICQITNGTRMGSNLFHSFQDFSLPTGSTAHFNNPSTIQNIFSRVTGETISDLDGRIQTNGTANLFLLNPNGIVFGPNARLDISGSFVASTASSMIFSDGTVFSATDSQPSPLLTISVPIGLQYGATAQEIRLQGSELGVQPGNTLALIGGDVNLDGAQLWASGGRVELAGVAGGNTVALNVTPDLSLLFPDEVARADVSMTNQAVVKVRGQGGGSIAINADNLDISGASRLQAGLLDSVGSVAGDIEINTTGAINLTNQSVITNLVQLGAMGKGGSINITTGSLTVENSASLGTATLGKGDAGSVIINAKDTVQFDGDNSIAGSIVETNAVGDGGDINITTGSIFLTNGAQLQVMTRGQGNAGSITIQAEDSIFLDGVGTDGIRSTLFAKADD
ncbi:MAG: filamentous hemagglutinin N-terminal domain-containing protein, partial [Coleofasciculus sp. C2-GNP5-27]